MISIALRAAEITHTAVSNCNPCPACCIAAIFGSTWAGEHGLNDEWGDVESVRYWPLPTNDVRHKMSAYGVRAELTDARSKRRST